MTATVRQLSTPTSDSRTCSPAAACTAPSRVSSACLLSGQMGHRWWTGPLEQTAHSLQLIYLALGAEAKAVGGFVFCCWWNLPPEKTDSAVPHPRGTKDYLPPPIHCRPFSMMTVLR